MKSKKCKICKNTFEPVRFAQIVCSMSCAIEHSRALSAKKEKKDTRERKKALKSRAEWLKEAQAAINRYVRARDYGKECPSCGVRLTSTGTTGGSYDCGHWRSIGSAPHMRFNLLNMAGQCKKCNRYLSGASIEMEKGLIKRYGRELVEAIKYKQFTAKFTIDYLVRIKKIFNKRAIFYEKRL